MARRVLEQAPMKTPGRPSNEASRLAALESYQILDTPEDVSFDGLARLAAEILEVPIALVSLVDNDRQWFKARHGLDVTHTSREVSFCGHVVEGGSTLVVPDAKDDRRFFDNPLTVGEPWVRFYAGVPLTDREGYVLGTLCAIDRVPRQPTPKQLELLKLLAKQVVDQLESHRLRLRVDGERVAALRTLRRFEALFDSMAEGVVVQAADGAIVEANRAATRILGLTVDQLTGRKSVDPRWESIREDGTPFPGAEHPAMVTLRTGAASTGTVMGLNRLDDSRVWISINSAPIADPVGGVLSTFHDITALKAAQDRAENISRQEHLITTGTLASGIGHEINNPLTFITANLEFALEELQQIAGGSPSQRLTELVNVMRDARIGADRIRKIVRGLQALARSDTEAIPTQVDAVIEVSVNMAAHEWRPRATVKRALSPTPPAHADEARLTQVLVNLLVNAAQAFVTADADRNLITVSTSAVDGKVVIEVSDNGPGIPPEVLPRIFDPFFTTKPVGQGTGLGLSISRNMVKTLGGDLVVTTAVGKGTTFRVVLPCAVRPLGAQKAAVEPRRPRGRVLVIDDEVGMHAIFRRLLEPEHEVTALADARQALALLERGEPVDVIFCDLMMPLMGGPEFHARLAVLRPRLAERLVFITGGTAERESEEFLARVPNERLEKPFTLAQVREVVRRSAVPAGER